MINLPAIQGTYKTNYNLSHLTWFKVGGKADIFFKPANTQDLAHFLRQNQNNLPITIIGAGSNMIIRDGGVAGVVIKLGQAFTQIEFITPKILVIGAGCLNINLARFCKANNVSGLEFLSGIPGSIGGGVVMNAGAYCREFKDIIIWVEALDAEGNLQHIKAEEIKFKYRGNDLPKDLIITKVAVKIDFGQPQDIAGKMQEISLKRNISQPVKTATGGSTFANPISGPKAWELIDQAGMRGARIEDAQISELHCNFMINLGSATAKNLEELGNLVQKKVFQHSGYKLEWEIKRIGRY